LFKAQPAWFDEGSHFRRDIEAVMQGIEWRVFKWSGENSEIERRKAARGFATTLRRELDTAPEACHVVIAHSHGGNVALWGLGQLEETKRDRVAGLATMGTPFLHFAPRKLSVIEALYLRVILSGQVILPFLIFALLVGVMELTLERGQLGWYAVPGAVLVGITIYMVWRKQRGRTRELPELELQHQPIWPDRLASFLALRSRGDEASRVIAVADAAARSFISAWSIVRLCTKLMPWDDRSWRRKVFHIALIALVVLTAVTLIHAAIAPAKFRPFLSETLTLLSFPAGWPDWLGLVAFVVFLSLTYAFLLTVFILGVVCLPFSIATAIIFYSQVLLGLAFGHDTHGLAISTEIAAEPNPPRPALVLEHVDPGDADTRHSVHALPAARTRLAAWIRERQATVHAACAWQTRRGHVLE
jgi:hypothetical protein